jgi:hypothetical protein
MQQQDDDAKWIKWIACLRTEFCGKCGEVEERRRTDFGNCGGVSSPCMAVRGGISQDQIRTATVT